MAKKTRGVWGIDIGQTAFRALRCSLDEDGNVVADSYDFIEYPKILSLPDADEEALIDEALDTFLSRNDVRGDFVGMTVSGQSGLSRFFKPPPVDARTLPDIVKYEVRQQIPFPIEDVIWDWQSLGGSEMDGVLVDTEVGLFAIKRDTVYTALQPFLRKDIEVDLVQLSPLATQNVVCREVLEEIPDDLDVDNLPDSVVVLSMGTDATDLIVTNGVRLWLRNIPIGGNHFTKELSRELKLTHAKAEHLKRNARQAEDPKTVFQAMRRVFNDLKKEIDRSLSFYSGIDKNARLERIVLLGNAAQLPGLRQYLTKQLEMDIVKLNDFSRLQGPVIQEQAFQENLLSFTPAYGLCLQGLNQARMNTNLLPLEFVNERIIRAKKPWILASVSLLMLGMLFSYFFVNQRWWSVNENYSVAGHNWKEAITDVSAKSSQSSDFVNTDEEQRIRLTRMNAVNAELSEASEIGSSWGEVLSALEQIMPRDPRLVGDDGLSLVANPDEVPFEDRKEFFFDDMETKFYENLTVWGNSVILAFREQQGNIEAVEEARAKLGKKSRRRKKLATEYDISGPGWVIQLQGHHFYNSEEVRRRSEHGIEFVKQYLLDRMLNGTVSLPNQNGAMEDYRLEDVGLYYPTVVAESPLQFNYKIPNPLFGREGRERDDEAADGADNGDSAESGQDNPGSDGNTSGGENTPPGGEDQNPDGADKNSDEPAKPVESFEVVRYNFILQMAHIPTTAAQRDANKAARLAAEAEEAKNPAPDDEEVEPESAGPPPAPVVPPAGGAAPPATAEPPANPADDAAPPAGADAGAATEPPPGDAGAADSNSNGDAGDDADPAEPPPDGN